jgi:transketolase
MTVLVPADATEAYKAVLAAAEITTPVYIRLGRYATPVFFGEDYRFEIGTMPVMRQGADLTILATGIMTALAQETDGILAESGCEAAVLNVSTIKPLDQKSVLDAAVGKKLCVTMEEHWISGGLGSAVAETLAEVPAPPVAPARCARPVRTIGYGRRTAGAP